jgi:lactate 2-monooxygenase
MAIRGNPNVTSAALQRQTQIYINGAAGQKPPVPVDIDELEIMAEEAMSDEAYAYVAGGAGLESTIEANRFALERWRIVPRMLRDVGERDTSVELFGHTLPAPILLAPIGVQELAHEEADLATAKAAAASGVPMVFSNQASVPMEDCAEVMGETMRCFQLYWGKNPELVESLAKRAEACGCSAIFVTLDTTLLGWRVRDLDLAYLPFIKGMGIAQYTSDPVFRGELDEPPEENILAAAQLFMQTYANPTLNWDDLAFLRERTRLPIVLKGINHPEDAKLALEHGMDGVVVSNHGGRQVDGALGAFDALPGVVEAIGGQVPVLFDSGIRGGADIFKALAMGARAVLLGRPYIWGLAVAGQTGVQEVIANMIAEFDLTLGLAGETSARDLKPEMLRKIG